jgi:hypothetical protein
MTDKTTVEQRRQFQEQHQGGRTYAEIAERYGVSAMCVRYWCRKQRAGPGQPGRGTKKEAGLLSRFDGLVHYAILRLRLEHPGWGPNRIRSGLRKRASLLGKALPSEAEIGRYLHQWKRFRRQPSQKPKGERAEQPERVHQRWQIDFKVQIRLKGGVFVILFTVRDPVGEAIIGGFIYPSRRRGRVTLVDTRAVLRRCFEHWGTLPEEVQTDGEATLVSTRQNNFPSLFTLWLKGLGIQHRVITKVTQNAEVERCHRTVYEYAVRGNEDQSPSNLQHTLDQAVQELNYDLPSRAEGCDGQPPISAHPELLSQPRPYLPELEQQLFDLARVDQFLQTQLWIRQVESTGQVSIGPRRSRYTLPKRFAGQQVEVRFASQDRHFVFSPLGQPDVIIRRCPVKHLDLPDLTGWQVWPSGPGPQQLVLPLFDLRGKLLMSN